MKYALVTGSTQGIGKAIADGLVADGYTVFRNGRRKECSCKPYIQADLSSIEGVGILVDSVLKETDILHCLVLNAGSTCRKTLKEITLEDWSYVMNVNLNMPFFLVQKLIGHMAEESNILFISSAMSLYPHATSIPYGVSKAAVNMLAKCMVKELEERRIRVNVVCPGFIDTEWQKEKPDWLHQKIEGKIALKRFGTPQEVAQMCLSLCRSTYMNGAVVTVDGGYNTK